MKLFKRSKSANSAAGQLTLAEIALNAIHDGVIMTDKSGVVKYINPAAAQMTNCGGSANAIGLDCGLILRLESKEGRTLSDQENPLTLAIRSGQPLESHQATLITMQSGQRLPIAISVQAVADPTSDRIITFRNITRELEEEGEQAEFISTASHEMRTPVATIDGYLSLCLNPQTATVDERARGYLTAAQAASKHLGELFQNLLDITKLDDGHIKPHFQPVEMTNLVKTIASDYAMHARDARLGFTFGSSQSLSGGDSRRMSQVIYGFVDVNFMREILDNLIGNAIKYTPEGGSIYINVRGDGDRALITVTDTGIGISAEDLGHIFQKFYRVDNSDTRTIGGTGLGLYLVKQRAEAMGGKVWAESTFGEGSTFYVSLPRISADEYEKRMIAVRNLAAQQQAMQAMQSAQPFAAPTQPQPTTAQPTAVSPQPIPPPTPTQPSQSPPAPPPSPPIQSSPPAPPPLMLNPFEVQPPNNNTNQNGELR